MATCDSQVGVRNIMIKFFDCDTGQTYGPLAHELAGDAQPTYRTCPFNNEALPGGYTKKTKSSNEMTLVIVRNLTVPLAMYQGCAALDITVEHYNGITKTGLNGTATGNDASDAHEVSMTVVFREINEDLPG